MNSNNTSALIILISSFVLSSCGTYVPIKDRVESQFMAQKGSTVQILFSKKSTLLIQNSGHRQ